MASAKIKHLKFSSLNLCVLIVSCVFLSSCFQITSLQTAKTLEKNKTVVGFSAAAYGVTDDFFGGESGLAVVPSVEVFARKGFAKKFDAGLKLSSSANILADGKLQLVGDLNSKFALATGLGFEYQYSNFENFVSRQSIPIYFSYHPNTNFAVYSASKFVHQFVSDGSDNLFIGENLGITKRINNRFSIIAEGSFFLIFDKPFKYTEDFLYNGGLGFVFDIK